MSLFRRVKDALDADEPEIMAEVKTFLSKRLKGIKNVSFELTEDDEFLMFLVFVDGHSFEWFLPEDLIDDETLVVRQIFEDLSSLDRRFFVH